MVVSKIVAVKQRVHSGWNACVQTTTAQQDSPGVLHVVGEIMVVKNGGQ